MASLHSTIVALGMVGLTTPSAAQQITITPSVGFYAPLRDQGVWIDSDGCIDDRGQCPPPVLQTYRLDLKPGVSFGLKLALEWEDMGIEAFAGSAGLRRQVGADTSQPQLAHNATFGLRLTYRRPLKTRSDLVFGVGLAQTVLSSDSYCADGLRCISDRRIWGMVPSAALRIAPSPQTRLELSVADYIYTVRYPPQWLGNPARLILSGERDSFGQHDLVIAAGMGVVLRP